MKVLIMSDEREIWAHAGRIVQQHGDKARMIAAMRAVELRGGGDLPGCLTWSRILKAIEALQETKPRAGEWVH